MGLKHIERRLLPSNSGIDEGEAAGLTSSVGFLVPGEQLVAGLHAAHSPVTQVHEGGIAEEEEALLFVFPYGAYVL